jgi:hypothetical protein
MTLDPEPHPPRRHPRPPIYYVTPTGWRARCTACGWEQGRYHDQHDAIGGFLEHAENEHGVVIPDSEEDDQ